MKCPSCGTSNPDDYKFCQSCGANLPHLSACPSCGQGNPADYKFCQQCGAVLISADVPASENQAPTQAPAPVPSQMPAPDPIPEPTPVVQPAPAPQPAPPPVVIIQDGEKKKRSKGPVWAILGALLVMMSCCCLLWFDVADVPAGVINRLPPPLDNITGQIVQAIEDREIRLPVFGGPAAWNPGGNGGSTGSGQSSGGSDDCASLANIQPEVSFQADPLEATVEHVFPSSGKAYLSVYVGRGAFWINEDYSYQVSFKNYPSLGSQECVQDKVTSSYCEAKFDYPTSGNGTLDTVIISSGGCELAAIQVRIPPSDPPPAPPVPPAQSQNPCDYTKGNNAIRPGSINFALSYLNYPYSDVLAISLANNVDFPSDSYLVSFKNATQLGSERCQLSASRRNSCEVFFKIPANINAMDTLIISTDDDKQCELAAIPITIPDPPPSLPPSPPPGGSNPPSSCPAGETFHDGFGCCTDGCWCVQSNLEGCWQTCNAWCSD